MKMKTIYDKMTEKYESLMVDNLYKFVAIPSVLDESTASKENPFGIEVSNALKFIAEVAKKDGFKVTNYDNMVVEIIAGDESTKNVTIMAHADVVPAGSGWEQDPFKVEFKDGVFYGRGVADDKGPLLSCYYGLLALKENNLINGYHVRFLVGGNEESGSLGMLHYFYTLKKKQPDLGFSPDSAYPLTYGEKGIMGIDVSKKVKSHVVSIKGGVAHNAVIESCVVTLNKDDGFIKYLKDKNVNFKFVQEGDLYKVTFIGKAAHGSLPWLGINAGLIALKCVGEYYHEDDLLFAYNCFSDPRGKGVHADAYSEDMHDNSLCVGYVTLENNELYLSINFRYVNTVTGEEMIEKFKENCAPMGVKVTSNMPVLYYPLDSVLVSTLMKSYQEESGDYESKPLTSGGGTYAKEAQNVVAFGMEKQGWDSLMHAPGEKIEKSNLVKSMAICARAINDLGEQLKK